MNISFLNNQLNMKNNIAFKANSVKNAQKAIIDLEISDKIIDSLIIKKQTLDKISESVALPKEQVYGHLQNLKDVMLSILNINDKGQILDKLSTKYRFSNDEMFDMAESLCSANEKVQRNKNILPELLIEPIGHTQRNKYRRDAEMVDKVMGGMSTREVAKQFRVSTAVVQHACRESGHFPIKEQFRNGKTK
ncbi:hypothetical protein IKU74_06490 [bacterium]|nr:hypothetical protein [bacterium]